MIEEIRLRNRSASSEFLMVFDEQALSRYLDRLRHVVGHRGRGSRWIRPAETPAVVMRSAMEAA